MTAKASEGDSDMSSFNTSTAIPVPKLPDYPVADEHPFIDLNYLMPFSIMLMILCILLLVLCYLRHRIKQRRMLQRELRLAQIMRAPGVQRFDDFGLPVAPIDRVLMMYPPTYDEATQPCDEYDHHGYHMHHHHNADKLPSDFLELPPTYTEAITGNAEQPALVTPGTQADHLCITNPSCSMTSYQQQHMQPAQSTSRSTPHLDTNTA